MVREGRRRKGQAERAYQMLLSMENEWRVPDKREYSRMMKQFKWNNHREGKIVTATAAL